MLFVFGYRAQKLRLKKLAHLIHQSDTHPDCTYCEVQVHFAQIDDAGGDDFNVVPGSEFVVSRTATKNNSSTYHLSRNGSQPRVVQFKEVSKLLESYGIDLKYNRFLILQGEVEQIALMKPKAENENETGMLEFLEDIIGSNRLVAPLTKLQMKVEGLNDLRSEKMNRVRVVEKEKAALEGPMVEAVKFLKTENEIAVKKNEFYQTQRLIATKEEIEAELAHSVANEKYQEAMKEIDAVKEQRMAKVEEVKKLIREFEDYQKVVDKNLKEFNELEKKDLQLQDKIKHTKTKGKTLLQELSNEQRKLTDFEELPTKLKEEIEGLQEKKEALENKRADAEQNLSKVMGKINKETEVYQKEKEEIQTKLLELQKGVNEAKAARDDAQNKYDIYMRQDKAEKSKLDQFKVKYETTQREITLKKDALEKYLSEVPKMEKELAGFRDNIAREEDRMARYTEEYRTLRSKLSEAQNKISANRSQNRIIASLMEQKRKGKLSGIQGRLGDLGAIDAKYDVAISTACGALDNIVVDTIEDGQRAVRFLKENNLGVATFLALDKLSYMDGRWNQRFEAPENVHRLFDLITCENKFRIAFYYALQNTLVADNLTQARRITQHQRLRVVTLDGKLMEMSGAMSGGGRPRSGRMGTELQSGDEMSEQQIQQLSTEVNRCSQSLNDCKEKISSWQRSVEKLTIDLTTMKDAVPKVNMEVETRERSLEELKKSIKNQEKVIEECIPDKNEIKRLQSEIDSADRKYQRTMEGTAGLEEKVHDIDIKIQGVMDKNLGSCKKTVAKLKNEIENIEEELTKKSASLKSTERNIEKARNKIESLEKETNETKAHLDALKEEYKANEASGQEITTRYQQSKNELDEMEKGVQRMSKAVRELKDKETQLTSDNLDGKHEVDKLLAELEAKRKEVQDWTARISKLQLHRIPGANRSRTSLPSAASQSSGTNNDQPSTSKTSAEVEEDEEERVLVIDPQLSEEYLNRLNSHALRNKIDELENECKKMKPNMAAIEEYRKKEDLYRARAGELKEVTDKRDEMKNQHEMLRKQRMEEFKAGFLTITRKLKEMYRMITSGGDAELEWADSLDPFSEGINFSVRPNKKSWKRISNLSGGEKTLSSLSLIFALHFYKPSPLYVMDEIDAALDFKNVSIVANYIKERTKNTQFIIISLRNNMYELANRLIGIYKTHNCTKSVPFEYDTWPALGVQGLSNPIDNNNGTRTVAAAGRTVVAAESGSQRTVMTTTIEVDTTST